MSNNLSPTDPVVPVSGKWRGNDHVLDEIMENASPNTKDALELLSTHCKLLLERHFTTDPPVTASFEDEATSVKDVLAVLRKENVGRLTSTVRNRSERFEKKLGQPPEFVLPYALNAEAEKMVDWVWENLQQDEENVSEDCSSSIIWPPTHLFTEESFPDKENVYLVCGECREEMNGEVSKSGKESCGSGDTSAQNSKELFFSVMGWKESENMEKREAFDLLLNERRTKTGCRSCLVCGRNCGELKMEAQSFFRLSSGNGVSSIVGGFPPEERKFCD